MQVTFCEHCDNVHAESRKRLPSNWLCTQFPRLEGQGFVAPKVWAEMEPYMRCANINGGRCPAFSPLKKPNEPQLNLSKETKYAEHQ